MLVRCFTSQQQARVSQRRICLDNLTCCHTEIEVADQTIEIERVRETGRGEGRETDRVAQTDRQTGNWIERHIKTANDYISRRNTLTGARIKAYEQLEDKEIRTKNLYAKKERKRNERKKKNRANRQEKKKATKTQRRARRRNG